MVQPCNDPDKIADAVAIAVLEAARIDLVDHGTAPPIKVRGNDIFGAQGLHGSHRGGRLSYFTDPANRPRTR